MADLSTRVRRPGERPGSVPAGPDSAVIAGHRGGPDQEAVFRPADERNITPGPASLDDRGDKRRGNATRPSARSRASP